MTVFEPIGSVLTSVRLNRDFTLRCMSDLTALRSDRVNARYRIGFKQDARNGSMGNNQLMIPRKITSLITSYAEINRNVPQNPKNGNTIIATLMARRNSRHRMELRRYFRFSSCCVVVDEFLDEDVVDGGSLLSTGETIGDESLKCDLLRKVANI